MGTQLNQLYTFKLIAVNPYRNEVGMVMTRLTLITSENTAIDVEVPYSEDYSALPLGGSISASIRDDNTIDLYIFPETEIDPYIGRHITCPFCGTTLVNVPLDQSRLYCLNPACDTDLTRKLFYTFSRLSIEITEIEYKLILFIMKSFHTNDIHLISITRMLGYLIKSNQAIALHLTLYKKLATFITQCKPSEFLTMLQIPIVYYEKIQVFDIVWNTVELFFSAMQNYRSMDPGLITYDADLMGLIYTNLHVNQKYIEEFFICKASILSINM